MINYENLLLEVEKVEPGLIFKVSDLFVPLIWKQVDLTTRRQMAIRFKNEVEEKGICNIETAGKNTSSAQLYKKKK
ncbi:DUF1413 domain-containing protein [Carnobacterium maltaromaticum]|uniref:DUF1413 domain-containing protein n=1 Tax=Carnobacterium maltaromaticum TaxID=2751 RepID=UPI00054E6A0D|nr:DUF1413 domain-containing protein [Carnobacterium maltaromaticum]